MTSPPVLSSACLSSPLLHGYLLRRSFNKAWVRYWCVVQGGCLYCYLTPDDHVSVDVTDLDGYSVTSHEDTFPEQRFVLYLEHKDYIPVYLSASCRKEMEEWKASLTSALKVTVQTNCHCNQRHEDGAAAAAAAAVKGGSGARGDDRALMVKQKLLAEVLRQTQELERKHSSRMTTSKTPPSSGTETPVSPAALPTSRTSPSCQGPPPPPTSTPHPNWQTAGDQICTRTRLKQRRMSAQIKLDTLQKQIQTSNCSTKKSIFSFVKKKSSSSSSSSSEDTSAPHRSDIVRQLKVLSDRLNAIDRDLVLSSGVLFVDNKMAPSYPITSASSESRLSLNRCNSSHSRRSSNASDGRVPNMGGTAVAPDSGSLGSGAGIGGVMRSNSLKNSVQKLAHKTFAKAGWYRSKKSSQSEASTAATAADKEEVTSPGPGYDVNAIPDVIDLSHRLRRTWSARDMMESGGGGGGGGTGRVGGGGGEGFPPPPSPFKGSPSPTSPTPRRVGSVCSGGGRTRRHSSSGSLPSVYDDPASPRQKIDPVAIAHIEEFEELSREILGEAPA